MRIWPTILIALIGLVIGCVHYRPAPLEAKHTLAAFESRSLADPILRSFVTTNLHRDFSEWPPKRWDLPALTLVAFFFHPSLEAARAHRDVAKAARKTAAARPNPTVTLQPSYNFDALNAVTPWIPGLSFDVPIETAGKRQHRLTQAEHLFEAARLSVVGIAWQIRANLRSALLEHTGAEGRVVLLENQRTAQQELLRLLEQRAAAGVVSRFETTPAQLALVTIIREVADARRQVAESRIHVAEALGLSKSAIEGIEFDYEFQTDQPMNELIAPEARQRALLSRADLLAALEDYAAAESALQSEIAKQYPNVHLAPSYVWDQGESKWTFGIGFELPVFNRNEGPIAEAEARRAEAAVKFSALQAGILADIDRALASFSAIKTQLVQSEKLLQTHQSQVRTLEHAFAAGASDRLEVQAARVEAAASDLVHLETQIKAQQVRDRLEEVMQQPLEALKVIEQSRLGETRKERP